MALQDGMELLYRGAEADLLLGKWSDQSAVYKLRKPMPYRLDSLDRTIRYQRTLHEAQMIHEARRAGVRTPYLYFVNPEKATIVMEYIEGEKLKTVLEGAGKEDTVALSKRFGETIGNLHHAGIMHGDLTTSNIMLMDGEMVFLDFGLSIHTSRLEDHAVDLRLIKETLSGAHSNVSSLAFSSLLEGYRRRMGDAILEATRRKLAEIERRGRYAKVE